MKKFINKNKLFGLRVKTLLPIILGGTLILIASIMALRNAIYTAGNNIMDMKLSANLAQITNNSITIDIQYKEGFDGVFSGFSINVKDEDIFVFDWVDSKEKQERQQLGMFWVGGYIYSPEEDAFLLAEPFQNNDLLLPRIDETFVGWHSGATVLDLFKTQGAARFQTGSGQQVTCWLGVSQLNSKTDTPHMILIGTKGQPVEGLMDYLSLTEGAVMLGILLVILFVVAFIISRTIGRVRRVNGYLKQVTNQSLPNDPLIVKSSDEIEEVATTVNEMISGLREKQMMQSELNSATGIQLGMLPKDFNIDPTLHRAELFAGMNPAKEVGGDFYDFFMPDDRHLALVIADVSGKGITAALFMAMGKTILRGSINSEISFSETMFRVNNFLKSNNDNGLFITVWAGLLDLQTGECRFCNAGHNPPLISRNHESFEYLTDLHGTVMGFLENVPYEEGKITLHSGDKLFLYTDGVTEAKNNNNKFYGEDRLKDCMNKHTDLSPKDTVSKVKSDVSAFVDGADQSDDITMLMIEYFGADYS